LRETHRYDDRILAALAVHGLIPRPDTAPEKLRDAVGDLYRFEIRRLRAELVAGRIARRDYAGRVVELRKRYWLLSVPVQAWTRPESG
jgi:hypothetical protein